jgi:hypothetical protein
MLPLLMAARVKPAWAQLAMAWSRVAVLGKTVNFCPAARVARTAKMAADDAIIGRCCFLLLLTAASGPLTTIYTASPLLGFMSSSYYKPGYMNSFNTSSYGIRRQGKQFIQTNPA